MKYFFRRKAETFFSQEDTRLIVKAIRQAEQNTSGEVRVFVESRCKWMDAIDRAKEIFDQLQMEKTEQRNATLVYVAVKDRQVAVYGDIGIYQKAGAAYWGNVIIELLSSFNKTNYASGIADAVIQIGIALSTHFPYTRETDKNELPDNIVFGR